MHVSWFPVVATIIILLSQRLLGFSNRYITCMFGLPYLSTESFFFYHCITNLERLFIGGGGGGGGGGKGEFREF